MKKAGMLFLLFVNISIAQVFQKGVVYELNSGSKPIRGVEIFAIGSSVALSDDNGYFSLAFNKKKNGDPLYVKEINKKGYELVNEEVNNGIFTTLVPFRIIMCTEGLLEETRRKYYKIGEDYYKKRYDKEVNELKKQKELNHISEEKFNTRIKEANEELKKRRENLDYYTDRFSRINKDELNELDKSAIILLEQGKIDEAIKVYEDAKILETFLTKLAARDTASYNLSVLAPVLISEIDLLIKKYGYINNDKAETVLKTIAKSDSMNFIYVFKYAVFLTETEKISDSFNWFKKALKAAKTINEKRLVIQNMEKMLLLVKNSSLLNSYKTELDQLRKELK